MKKIGLMLVLFISSLSTHAGNALSGNALSGNLTSTEKKDTTVVEFTDKGIKKRLSVMTNGKKNFQIPSSLNLNNLLREIGVDTLERNKAIVLLSQDGDKRDTILVISKDGRKIKIIANEPKGMNRSDTLRREEPIQRHEPRSDGNDDVDNNRPKDRSKERFFSRTDFNLYFGLNNWHSTNTAITAPDLSSLGSRYVALSWRKNIVLSTGRKAELAFSYAPEVAWYNFMFTGNKYASMNTMTNQVQFMDNTRDLSKSKLVVPSINLPLMLNVGLKESRFMFGVGGYVGYTIDPYTKVKYAGDGGKDHVHQNFNTNNVRYGLTAELGRKGGLTLFFRYDLNPIFKSNQQYASSLQGWSAGLRLL